MYHPTTSSIVFALLALFSLSSCGGGSSSSTSSTQTETVESEISETLTITPSLGRISDAQGATTKTTVTVYDEQGPAGGNVLGQSTLDSDGTASVRVTYNEVKPIVVQLKAGSNASYYDEAAGTEVDLNPGYKLHALYIVPGDTAVTPLTELGYRIAQKNNIFPVTEESVEQVNHAVSALFSNNQLDLNDAPHVVDGSVPSALAPEARNLHAAALAALAQVGSDQGAPVVSVLDALSNDIGDGVIDGYAGGNAIANLPYPSKNDSSDFATVWRDAFGAWAQQHLNRGDDYERKLAPLAENRFLPSAGLLGADKLKAIAGQYPATVKFSNNGGNTWTRFAEGDVFSAVITADGKLEIHAGNAIQSNTTALSDWSVGLDDADILDQSIASGNRVIRVKVPTSQANLERSIMMVSNNRKLDSFYLIEDDTTTTKRDRIAHVISSIPSKWKTFFSDLKALSGTSLTLVVDTENPGRECMSVQLGASTDGNYPESLGLLDSSGQNEILSNSIQPHQVRYAESGNTREMMFRQKNMIRHATNDTIDVVRFERPTSRTVQLWATNDSNVVNRECP